MKLTLRFKGGPGSGHHGHSGVPGQQGGSAPKGGRGGETEANAMARLVTSSIQHNQPKPKAVSGVRSRKDFEDNYMGFFKLDHEVETVQGNGERYYTPRKSFVNLAKVVAANYDTIEHTSWSDNKDIISRIADWDDNQDSIELTSNSVYSLLGTMYRVLAKYYDGKDIGPMDTPRWYV